MGGHSFEVVGTGDDQNLRCKKCSWVPRGRLVDGHGVWIPLPRGDDLDCPGKAIDQPHNWVNGRCDNCGIKFIVAHNDICGSDIVLRRYLSDDPRTDQWRQ